MFGNRCFERDADKETLGERRWARDAGQEKVIKRHLATNVWQETFGERRLTRDAGQCKRCLKDIKQQFLSKKCFDKIWLMLMKLSA